MSAPKGSPPSLFHFQHNGSGLIAHVVDGKLDMQPGGMNDRAHAFAFREPYVMHVASQQYLCFNGVGQLILRKGDQDCSQWDWLGFHLQHRPTSLYMTPKTREVQGDKLVLGKDKTPNAAFTLLPCDLNAARKSKDSPERAPPPYSPQNSQQQHARGPSSEKARYVQPSQTNPVPATANRMAWGAGPSRATMEISPPSEPSYEATYPQRSKGQSNDQRRPQVYEAPRQQVHPDDTCREILPNGERCTNLHKSECKYQGLCGNNCHKRLCAIHTVIVAPTEKTPSWNACPEHKPSWLSRCGTVFCDEWISDCPH